jgi:hypothetical protein
MWKVFFIIPQNMVKIYLLEQNISAKSFYSELLEQKEKSPWIYPPARLCGRKTEVSAYGFFFR